jgi:hypothetical protein
MSDDVELCPKWGYGKDRCIRHYDHDGDCKDAEGLTSSTLPDWLAGRRVQPIYE